MSGPGAGTRIAHVTAVQALDSRGRPTVCARVTLQGGADGVAFAPSGASTGAREAVELRDGDPKRFGGRGVDRALHAIRAELAPALQGLDAVAQAQVDQRLREADGTANFARLGANAATAVSLAVCRAAARARGLPLWRHIAELAQVYQPSLPCPMVNVLSGGLHASKAMDLQDFLIVPMSADGYAGALQMASSVRDATQRVMADRGLSTLLADEGGLSPGCSTVEEAFELLLAGIEAAGFAPAADVAIALDLAANGLRSGAGYHLPHAGRDYDDGAAFIDQLRAWTERYPVVSLEDPLAEEDWAHWCTLTRQLSHLQIVGDDLLVTQAARIERAARTGAANAALIKVNQNGTLTGALAATAAARAAGLRTIVSARSGETEDDFIADLAVGLDAGQIKIGSTRNAERLSKYNRLAWIAHDAPALPFRPFQTQRPPGGGRADPQGEPS